jgi:O-antigen ligase
MTSATHAAGPAMAPATERRIHIALWILLCFFLFILPVGEGPKNIAAVFYLLLWMFRAAWTRDAGGSWDRFDTVFAFVMGSAALSAAAGYSGDLMGVVRVFGVAWVTKRIVFSRREQMTLLAAGSVGLVVALAMAAVPFMRGSKTFLELPSVGHVNQSALYIAVLACAALGWSLQGRQWGRAWFASSVASALLFGLALLVSASRAAILAYGVFLVVVVLALLWRHGSDPYLRRLLAGGGVLLAVTCVGVVGLSTAYPKLSGTKLQAKNWSSGGSVDVRLLHWNLAFEGWRHSPWLGSGPDAFQQLTLDRVCGWRLQRGESCDPGRYAWASHAHSLYFATLAERGLLGAAALLSLLGLWLWMLAAGATQMLRSPLWMGSAAAFVVVAVAGVFNTTLRVEHGSLAMLMLALWLADRRPAG